MKKAMILVVLLLLPSIVHAEPDRQVHSRRLIARVVLYPVHAVKGMAHDRNFLIGIAILGAAQFADGLTTDRLLRGCAGCFEQNPLFGRRPGTARIYGQGTGIYLAEAFTYWELRRRAPEKYRDAVFLGIGVQSIVHGVLAKGNADLLVRARPAYLKP